MRLIKTIAEVRKYITLDANMQWDDFKPFIDEAEQTFIKPLLGDFYPVLLADYTDETDATGIDDDTPAMVAANLTLMPYVQRALANYAAYQSLNVVGLSIGSEGLQEMFGQNSRPASRWKVHEAKQYFIQNGDKQADNLLQYLEDNASLTTYTEWFNDAVANTAMSGAIVYKTSIASQYVDIGDCRRIFLRMKKRIKEIEATDIKRMICTEQYDEIVQQLQDDEITAENRALLDVLEPYITKKAFAKTLPYIRVSVTDEGIRMISSNDGAVSKNSASDNILIGNNPYREVLKAIDTEVKDQYSIIDQFLIDNIADYPLIEASTCYTAKALTPPKYAPDNNSTNKHFSV